jgi:hypothetical protein
MVDKSQYIDWKKGYPTIDIGRSQGGLDKKNKRMVTSDPGLKIGATIWRSVKIGWSVKQKLA